MQVQTSEQKKPFRARGSRGGRKKKGSWSQSKEQDNNQNSSYYDEDMQPISHSHYHKFGRMNSQAQVFHPSQLQAHVRQNYMYHPHVPQPYPQVQPQSHYSEPPPPLELIQTSSSFSSHSSSSVHHNDYVYPERNLYTNGTFQYTIGDFAKNYSRNSWQGSAYTSNGCAPAHFDFEKEVNQTKVNNMQFTRGSWTSLFCISPRSFLMGGKANFAAP